CERSEHCCLPRAITQLGGAARLGGWNGRQRGNERGRWRRDEWRAHCDGKSGGTKYPDGAERENRPATTRPPLRLETRKVRPRQHSPPLPHGGDRFIQTPHLDGWPEMLGATPPAPPRERAGVFRRPSLRSGGRPVDPW